MLVRKSGHQARKGSLIVLSHGGVLRVGRRCDHRVAVLWVVLFR